MYNHACSELYLSLPYSEPWNIPITKHFQTLGYIHNTTLNIFAKAPSWTFDTVLKAPLFFRCFLTSRVTLQYLQHYISDVFRHIPFLFSKEHSASATLRHILNAVNNLYENSGIFRFLAYLGKLYFRHVQSYSQP